MQLIKRVSEENPNRIGWFAPDDNDLPAVWLDKKERLVKNKWGTVSVCVAVGTTDEDIEVVVAAVAEMTDKLADYLA
jgi:hypothetical protein